MTNILLFQVQKSFAEIECTTDLLEETNSSIMDKATSLISVLQTCKKASDSIKKDFEKQLNVLKVKK